MPEEFDARAHLADLAASLIESFAGAKVAKHPTMRGDLREQAARDRLRALLPEGVGIGSGFVVDSYGDVSNQQDIVLYERALCPAFPIGGGSSYFPVEGVIAVGEVKSLLTAGKLKDAFENVISAKRLRRRAVEARPFDRLKSIVPARHYCNPTAIFTHEDDGFSQRANALDQIFGFVLCHQFEGSGQAVTKQMAKLSIETPRHVAPNFISSLSDGFIVAAAGGEITSSAIDADELVYCDEAGTGFIQLIWPHGIAPRI